MSGLLGTHVTQVKIKEKQINGEKHILMAVPLIGKEKGESKKRKAYFFLILIYKKY